MSLSAQPMGADRRGGLQAGMDRRIALSALSAYGLAGFALVYFTFWSPPDFGATTAIVVLVAFLAFVGLNAAAWASWEIRYRARGAAR